MGFELCLMLSSKQTLTYIYKYNSSFYYWPSLKKEVHLNINGNKNNVYKFDAVEKREQKYHVAPSGFTPFLELTM